MAESSTTRRPDVSDMYAVHRVFRDTLGAAPELVGSATTDGAERVALIANYYDNILAFLEVHHGGEESIVFPLLEERCDSDAGTLARMAAQHHETIEHMERARRSLAAWPETGHQGGQEAVAALAGLTDHLTAHLDDEESALLPLAAEHLSVEEWASLPAHGFAAFEGDKVWLILGLIRERMTDEQREAMLAAMPPPAVDMWTGFGEQAFTELAAEVGSGAPGAPGAP